MMRIPSKKIITLASLVVVASAVWSVDAMCDGWFDPTKWARPAYRHACRVEIATLGLPRWARWEAHKGRWRLTRGWPNPTDYESAAKSWDLP